MEINHSDAKQVLEAIVLHKLLSQVSFEVFLLACVAYSQNLSQDGDRHCHWVEGLPFAVVPLEWSLVIDLEQKNL